MIVLVEIYKLVFLGGGGGGGGLVRHFKKWVNAIGVSNSLIPSNVPLTS